MHWQRTSALGELRGFRLSWRGHDWGGASGQTAEYQSIRGGNHFVIANGATRWRRVANSLAFSMAHGQMGMWDAVPTLISMSDATDGSGRPVFGFTICVSRSL